MTNHAFSSKETVTKSFSSKKDNIKSFSSLLNNSRYFESIIDGFYVSSSWLAKFTIANNIGVANPSQSLVFLPQRFSGSIVVDLDRTKTLVTHNLSPVFSSSNRMIFSMSENKNMGTENFNFNSNIFTSSGEDVSFSNVSFSMNDISISASPIVAKYYTVSDWDASLLSSLDSTYLGDLDYQNV